MAKTTDSKLTQGKVWHGKVGEAATRGQGEAKPGKIARDAGTWKGNVGPNVTVAKPRIGTKGP